MTSPQDSLDPSGPTHDVVTPPADAVAPLSPTTVWSLQEWMLVILAVLAGMAAFTFLGPILRPFLIAVFVFYVTRSAVRFLSRRGLPEWLGYIILLALTVLTVILVSTVATSESVQFRKHWPEHQKAITNLISKTLGARFGSINDFFNDYSKDAIEYVFEAGLVTAETLLMSFFYLIFLILGSRRMAMRVQRAYPGEEGETALDVSQQINEGMEEYMRVKSVVSLGMAASAAAIMYFFGLEQWLLWGVAFFLLNFITYFGSMAACVPPLAIAYLEMGPLKAALFTAALVLNRLAWIDYVEIKMSGKHMNIDSALLLLWVAYWGWQWGVIGLILAFPMATSLKIVLENLEPTRRMAVLLSDE